MPTRHPRPEKKERPRTPIGVIYLLTGGLVIALLILCVGLVAAILAPAMISDVDISGEKVFILSTTLMALLQLYTGFRPSMNALQQLNDKYPKIPVPFVEHDEDDEAPTPEDSKQS